MSKTLAALLAALLAGASLTFAFGISEVRADPPQVFEACQQLPCPPKPAERRAHGERHRLEHQPTLGVATEATEENDNECDDPSGLTCP